MEAFRMVLLSPGELLLSNRSTYYSLYMSNIPFALRRSVCNQDDSRHRGCWILVYYVNVRNMFVLQCV